MKTYKDFKFDISEQIQGYHKKLREVIKFGDYVIEPLNYKDAIKLLDSKLILKYSFARDGSGSVIILGDTFEMLFLCDKETKLFFPLVGFNNKQERRM